MTYLVEKDEEDEYNEKGQEEKSSTAYNSPQDSIYYTDPIDSLPPTEPPVRELIELLKQLQNHNIPVQNSQKKYLTLWQRVQAFAVSQKYAPVPFDTVPATPAPEQETPKVIVTVEPQIKAEPVFKWSDDQQAALTKISSWLTQTEERFFIMRGGAGVGKSRVLSELPNLSRRSLYFTTPTNKACKVLSNYVGVECKTIHSLLGLRMEAKEEKLVLTPPKRKPFIRNGSLLVIDEGSMVGKELTEYIKNTVYENDMLCLVCGDPLQLPPIGETRAAIWKATNKSECKALLKQVMRFDNQILSLSVRLRKAIIDKNFDKPPIYDDNDGKEGVWLQSAYEFKRELLRDACPEKYINCKALAWRNKTVNSLNNLIRRKLGYNDTYVVGDLIMLASPVLNDEDEIIGNTDDEGVIVDICKTTHQVEGVRVPIYRMVVNMNDRVMTLRVPIEGDETLEKLFSMLAKNALACRNNYDKALSWKSYWKVKNSFHNIRYNYGLTIHRAQGSTYAKSGQEGSLEYKNSGTVFVHMSDILCNPNDLEAYRCLLVGTTRPTHRLYVT